MALRLHPCPASATSQNLLFAACAVCAGQGSSLWYSHSFSLQPSAPPPPWVQLNQLQLVQFCGQHFCILIQLVALAYINTYIFFVVLQSCSLHCFAFNFKPDCSCIKTFDCRCGLHGNMAKIRAKVNSNKARPAPPKPDIVLFSWL